MVSTLTESEARSVNQLGALLDLLAVEGHTLATVVFDPPAAAKKLKAAVTSRGAWIA